MAQQPADYPLDYSNSRRPDPTATGRVREIADSASDQFKSVAAHAEEMAGKVADQAREYGEKAQQAAKNFKPHVEKSAKEQPTTTLTVAVGMGCSHHDSAISASCA